MRNLASGLLPLLVLVAAGGCRAPNDIRCSGADSCTCPANSTCEFDSVSCGPSSCSLECGAGAACTGSCGASCSVSCEPDAVCNVAIGQSGSVSCGARANCNVTCAGTCSVSCADGAACNLRCATDPGARRITGSASCT